MCFQMLCLTDELFKKEDFLIFDNFFLQSEVLFFRCYFLIDFLFFYL